MKRKIFIYIGLLLVTVFAGTLVILISKAIGIDPKTLKVSQSNLSYSRFLIGIMFSSIIIGSIYFVQRRILNSKFQDLGFLPKFLENIVIGLGIGILLALIVRFINIALAQNVTFEWTIPDTISKLNLFLYYSVFLFIVILNSFQEELLFRAFPLELFKKSNISIFYVLIGTSFIFSIVHNMTEPFSFLAFCTRFLMGFFLSLVYLESNSIWRIIGIHSGLNWTVWSMTGNWEMGGLTKLTINSQYNGQFTNLIVLLFVILIYWYLNKEKLPPLPQV